MGGRPTWSCGEKFGHVTSQPTGEWTTPQGLGSLVMHQTCHAEFSTFGLCRFWSPTLRTSTGPRTQAWAAEVRVTEKTKPQLPQDFATVTIRTVFNVLDPGLIISSPDNPKFLRLRFWASEGIFVGLGMEENRGPRVVPFELSSKGGLTLGELGEPKCCHLTLGKCRESPTCPKSALLMRIWRDSPGVKISSSRAGR